MENITIKDKTFGGIGVKEWLTKFERLTTLEIHKALLPRLSSNTSLETINYPVESYRCLQLFISIDNPDMQEEISEHKDYSKAMETNDWTTMRNILINLYKKFIRKYSRDDLEKVIREGTTSDDISEYTKRFNKVLENISEREKPNTFQSISDYLRGLGTLATKILNELKTEDLDEEGYPINLGIVQSKAKSFDKTSALLQKFERIAPINSTSETTNTKTDAAIDKLTSAMENMSLLVMKSFAQEQNKSIKTCPICDVAGHRKSVCEKFNQLLNAKYVKKNQQGLATWPDGSVIPVNYGKGGIYKLVMDKLDSHHPVNSIDIQTDPIAEIQPTYSCGIVYDEGPLLSKTEVNMLDLLCENGEEEAAHSLYDALAAQKRKGEETPTTVPTKKNRPWLENTEPQIVQGRTRFDYKFPNLDPDNSNKKILDLILNQNIPNITTKDILAIAPGVRKSLESEIKAKRIPSNSHSSNLIQEDAVMDHASTPRVNGHVEGIKIEVHIDGGSSINVIPKKTYDKLNVPLSLVDGEIVLANGEKQKFLGRCKLELTVGEVTVPLIAYVIPTGNYDFLAGHPWKAATSHVERTDTDGSTLHIIKSPCGQHTSTFRYESKTSSFKMVMRIQLERLCPPEIEEMYVNKTKFKRAHEKIRPVKTQHTDGSKPYDWNLEEQPTRTLTPEEVERRVKQLKIGEGNFLTVNESHLFFEICKKFVDVFAFSPEELGKLNPEIVQPYEIRTIPHTPWVMKPIQIPYKLREEAINIIKDRLRRGIIEPSHASYSNRYWIVPKKDGGHRFIQDLQPANAVTIKDSAVPPDLETYSEHFSGYAIYAIFDVYSGYDQYPLAVNSRDITTFTVPGLGSFRMTVLPQGGTNSVQAYQAAAVKCFEELIPDHLAPFIDDLPLKPKDRTKDTTEVSPGIRAFVKDFSNVLIRFFKLVRRSGLKLSPKKTSIGVPGINLVGHHCFHGGRLPMDRNKKKAIDWNKFRTLKDLRGFINCCGFFRNWIRDFSTIAEPLYRLTRKNVRFVIGEEQIRAIELLKSALDKAPVLRPLDYTKNMIVTVDSSPMGGGGYLGQNDDKGNRYANVFHSFTYSTTIRNYAQVKKELYCILRMLKWLKGRIFGCEITVETDCKPVIAMINNPDIIDPVLLRWTSYIRLFNPTFKHIPGSSNVVADYLSRLPRPGDCNDSELQQEEDKVEADIDYFVRSIDVKECPTIFQNIQQYLSTLSKPDGINEKDFKKVRRKSTSFFIKNGNLYKRSPKGQQPVRVLWKREDIQRVLQAAHEEAGHHGVQKTFDLIRLRYYWLNYYNESKDYVESCVQCQFTSTKRYDEELHSIKVAAINRKRFIDIQHMPKADGYQGIIEAREGVTGWIEAKMVKTFKTTEWIDFIYSHILCRYGCVGQIISDNGELNSALGMEFEQKYKVQLSFTNTYRPQSNAPVESGHKSIRRTMERELFGSVTTWLNSNLLEDLKFEWPKHFYSALWADRVSVRKGTGFSPFYLMYGAQPILPVENTILTWLTSDWTYPMTTEEIIAARIRQLAKRQEDEEKAILRLQQSKLKSKEYFDKKRRIRPVRIKIGDLVLLYESQLERKISRKFINLWTGPYVVLEVRDDGSYKIAQLDNSAEEVVAGNRIKLFKQRNVNVDGLNIGDLLVDDGLLSNLTVNHIKCRVTFDDVTRDGSLN